MKIRTYIKILSIISLSICFNSCDNVEKAKDGYDRIIYIDLDNCGNVEVVDDTLRDTNLEYRAEIDQLFKETFNKLDEALDGKLNLEIKGTREMRVNQFLEMEGGHFFVG